MPATTIDYAKPGSIARRKFPLSPERGRTLGWWTVTATGLTFILLCFSFRHFSNELIAARNARDLHDRMQLQSDLDLDLAVLVNQIVIGVLVLNLMIEPLLFLAGILIFKLKWSGYVLHWIFVPIQTCIAVFFAAIAVFDAPTPLVFAAYAISAILVLAHLIGVVSLLTIKPR